MTRRYLLTNLNSKFWKKIDSEEIDREIQKLNILARENRLFGELGPSDYTFISLKNVSHKIKKLIHKNGKIYGNVEFLPFVENTKKGKFFIRAFSLFENDKIKLDTIITWDYVPFIKK